MVGAGAALLEQAELDLGAGRRLAQHLRQLVLVDVVRAGAGEEEAAGGEELQREVVRVEVALARALPVARGVRELGRVEHDQVEPLPRAGQRVELAPERAAPDRPKKKKAKPKAPPPPKSEDQIDSPNRQTIGMLSVIAIVTFFLWIFARGGCNYHPPKETRDPRKVDLVDLARDPKDAALEFLNS